MPMRTLSVRLRHAPAEVEAVGTLAETGGRIFFEYDAEFLRKGVSLSPYRLPATPGLMEHTDRDFGVLPGTFNDSLPDGWGLLLMDRHFRRSGIDPVTRSPLDRLAYLGDRTMGALTYHPPVDSEECAQLVDLHALGMNAEDVFAGDAADVLPQLLRAGGSPGGARPKVLVGVRGDELRTGDGDLPEGFAHWLVKFSARADAGHAGPVEYAYARMAAAAGLRIPPTRLFEVGDRRWFGVERFDRQPGNRRVHMHTFANLLHADFRIPSTDYGMLLKVTHALTRHHGDVLEAFRRMVFNVAAHNRDDHGKNFSYLLDANGEWRLSPAYDLTFSPGPGGEHSMAIAGEGRAPTREHCLEVAAEAGLRSREATEAIGEVTAAVEAWPSFADDAKCPRDVRREISSALRAIRLQE